MPLSRHDAEEATRQLTGAILDAQEAYAESAHAHTANVLINRQSEMIALQNDLIRRAVS